MPNTLPNTLRRHAVRTVRFLAAGLAGLIVLFAVYCLLIVFPEPMFRYRKAFDFDANRAGWRAGRASST